MSSKSHTRTRIHIFILIHINEQYSHKHNQTTHRGRKRKERIEISSFYSSNNNFYFGGGNEIAQLQKSNNRTNGMDKRDNEIHTVDRKTTVEIYIDFTKETFEKADALYSCSPLCPKQSKMCVGRYRQQEQKKNKEK